MPSSTGAVVLKRELRQQIRTALSRLPTSMVSSESSATTARFLNSPAYQNAKSIAVYASMPNEFDTTVLLTDAFRLKKRVFLPRVTSKSLHEMVFLEVASAAELASWTPNGWGIREPPLEPSRAEAPHDVGLDVVVVPGVAFDVQGARCGQGMGFYDTFLAKYAASGRPMPKLVALALSVQIVGCVPVTAHDWNVDEVLFGAGREG